MREGLLWFDDDPKRSLTEKVVGAATRYRDKFGRVPNCCCVHPSMVDGEQHVGRVKIAPLGSVLRHHFWIGEEEV
jgi:hypothetical protein